MSKIDFPKSVPISGRVRICLELVKSIDLKGKKVLDVGSSFGWLEKELKSLSPREIIGVETNEEAVKFARNEVKGVKFLIGDALNVPVVKNYADVVILFDVIEHVPKGCEILVLKEINRVLKQNGYFLLSTPNKHLLSNFFDIAWYFGHRHYSIEEITRMLKQSGFKIKSIKARGSILSSFYLAWFYVMKRLTGKNQPRNQLLEKLDDVGYEQGKITDIFLIATK